MVNLLDVADVPRIVKSEKFGELNVHGLSIEGLAYLVKKHPGLFQMFDAKGNRKFEVDQIVDLGVEVFADFLAAGLGYPGNHPDYAQAAERCRKMNPQDAFEIGKAIFEESFPGGASNFFEQLVPLMEQAKVLKKQAAPNSPSEAPSQDEQKLPTPQAS